MDEVQHHNVAVNPQNIEEIGAAGLNYISRRSVRFIGKFHVNLDLKIYL
jgi:hypothetical protein